MGLFNKLNRNKEEKNMDNAFVATPHFYANADKRVFGAIALTEGNCTILPLNPKEEYKVDIYVDNSFVEVFINEGMKSFTFRCFNLNNEEHNVQFSHVNKGSINYYNK